MRLFLKYWLPVLLWMALIFSASGDKSSGARSSRIIGPIVRWLVPDISEKALDTVVYSVRKTAHITEFAILALLLWRALRGSAGTPRPWRWRTAALAFSLAVLYAISDEFHQSFVPSRQGQVLDILFDSLGAAFGLAALWLVGRWRKHW